MGLCLLHEPSEPRIDFIFIHGLGGGSRKTWSYSPHPGMFWPRDWLPNEEGFKHVRLHSYGYNSSWTDRKTSRLTIHDFAQSFVADMYNSPHLRRHGDTPIVLVAHSMGGLVAKKAYLLARRDPIYKALADRMHTMYFLGTPHRGAGSAQLAKLLVDLSSNSTKAFLDDLLPGSGTLDAINDEFRNACGGLELWSFFEGAATNFGLTSSLVVNKDSAVMGLPREHIQYLNADHRHICKFRDPTDTNYITLCRSFLTTIEAIETGMSFQHRDEYRSQMKMITSLLDLEHSPAADLFAIADKQQPGSCQWLTDHPTFREWVGDPRTWDTPDLLNQASPSLPPKLLWIHGRPGTGKTVAAGHVIRYLKGSNLDCSFYFFRYNDSSRSTLAGLLRSIAFQMSESSFEFRRCIVNFIKDGDRISKDDHHMLWNKLFLNRIFKCENFKPHFWIIDALDECSSKSASTLIHMVSRLDVNLPLRILITSRPGGQLERSFAQERIGFMGISTGQAESLNDIEAFLRARCPQLRDSGRYENLVAEMLSKSNGNFLWASLTMTALEDVYSVEDMHEALEQIPSEMNEFYSRILNSIVESRSADIAKCILTWVICSPTLLTLSELEAAVKLDIDKTLTASHSQLEAMCGHLISVDNHSLVHVTHLTVSAFLTQENTSFWIDRPAAHSRLAEVCLALLCGKEFSPPKSRRTDSGIKPEPPVLADYACLNFSHHIKHSASAVDPPLVLLDKFLRTNVLTWIERAAKRGDLSILLRTAQRLKAYLGRRARDRSPLGAEVQSVDAWIVDLPHVVAVFGRCLLDSPASIYFLIPPLCPPASVVSKLFAKPTRRLKVFGTLDDAWSDRLTCLIHSVEAVSIASCDRLLAVGLSNGEIHVYDCVTFDAVAVLCHGQSVRNLSFCTGSTFLASCSLRKLRLWHSRHPNNQAPVWESDLDFVTFDLLFSPDNKQLLLPNKNNIIEVFSVETGARQSGIQFLATSDSDSSDGSDQVTAWIPPARIRLDASQKLAALSYRGAAITVWNLEEKEEIGVFEKEGFEGVFSPPALDLVFNPLSDLELLAISYKDGTIATCNPWSLEQVCVQRQFVDILAATSDGRILAGGDALGVIHLFFFETLQPIYRISSLTESVQKIAFSFDNSMLFDVRGRCCNVWEPFVLVFKDGSDESSSEPQSEDVTIREPATDHLRTFVWGNAVTITAQTKDGSFLFAGRQDGVIDVYSLTTGEVVEKLHFHPDLMEIRFLEWVDEKNLLLSVNDGGPRRNKCPVPHDFRNETPKNGRVLGVRAIL
ncbi:hypothetical protein VTK73DRAFT_3079 [Phialemonium thermophilum]|uniref:GPI inositol-deacylase n=1 Tax=Phialemonium thermophilum TaxID=223376 RepID=A0ABR3X1G5_9PEZI